MDGDGVIDQDALGGAEALCIACEEQAPLPDGEGYCLDCLTAVGEAQDEANAHAFHGGSGAFTAGERMAQAYDALAERRK